MASDQYWIRRNGQQLLNVLQDGEKLHKQLKADYDLAQRNILKEIEALYGRFAKDNAISQADALAVIKGQEFRQWRMSMEEYLEEIEKSGNQVLLFELNTLAMRARINRLEALEGEVVAQMAKLAQIQDEAVGTHLRDSLADTYYKSMYEHYRYGDRFVFDLMKKHNVALSKSNIEKVLALPWSGSNYSRDIWKREFMIATKARDMVTRNILEGKSLEVLSREMTELLGNDYKHAARRLILTETAYVKGQGDLLTYDKLGVEEYEYLATLDNKTSKVCQDLDGEHFPISEAVPGVNYPPMHPHCRSTTIVYRKDKDEADTRVARNEAKETYKVPADMNYKEWYKKYVLEMDDLEEKGYNITTSKGVKVNLNSKHAKARMKQRGLTSESVENALTDPLHVKEVMYDAKKRPSQRYIGEDATVVLNTETGAVITAWKTGSRTAKKYRK